MSLTGLHDKKVRLSSPNKNKANIDAQHTHTLSTTGCREHPLGVVRPGVTSWPNYTELGGRKGEEKLEEEGWDGTRGQGVQNGQRQNQYISTLAIPLPL